MSNINFRRTNLSVTKNRYCNLGVLLLGFLILMTHSSPTAHAATYSENFGTTCFSLSSGMNVTFNGASVASTATAGYAHWASYSIGTVIGCTLRLNGINANLVVTFPSGYQPTSFSFDTYAVNGSQTAIVNYVDGSTANFVLLDSMASPNLVRANSFSGNGKKIASILFTPANNPDIYVIDNFLWNVSSELTFGSPTLSGVAYKGKTITVSVPTNLPGIATFYVDRKRIPACLKIATTGTDPNFQASCTYKPAVTGSRIVSMTLIPNDSSTVAASTQFSIRVIGRSGAR